MTFSGECFSKRFSRHQPSPPHAGDINMWRSSPRNPTASFQSSKSAEYMFRTSFFSFGPKQEPQFITTCFPRDTAQT